MVEKKEVTIYDIAERLGISASTVSRALKGNSAISDTMIKKIRKTADQLGYQPNVFAASIRKKKTNTIGVLIPRISSEFMSKAITAIESVLNKAGYNSIISQSNESYQKEVSNARILFNSRVDGLVVSLANDTLRYDHFKPFVNKQIPIVFFDRVCDKIRGVKITIDDREAAFNAVTHLIQSGKKRIAIIMGPQSRNVYKNRFMGYKNALAEHSINYDESLRYEGILTIQNGRSIVQEMLKTTKMPDAIFACNDASAIGCIMELKKHKIDIPKDIAIVGFNNDNAAEIIDPGLSTVNHPTIQMGEIAARKILERINNPGEGSTHEHIILKTDLMIRKSS